MQEYPEPVPERPELAQGALAPENTSEKSPPNSRLIIRVNHAFPVVCPLRFPARAPRPPAYAEH